MVDAALGFLLNNIRDLLLYNISLITDTKDEINDLEKDLRIFKSFLNDSTKRRRTEELVNAVVLNIRDVVFDVEDIMDKFVIATRAKKKEGIAKSLLDLREIGKQVKAVVKDVQNRRKELNLVSVAGEDKYEKPEVRPPRPRGVVGFEDVMTDLKSRLTRKTDYLDVISLTGMFGLGKTTVAWKVFNDKDIELEFGSRRIWLTISQHFSNIDVYLAILKECVTLTEELREKNELQLSEEVAHHLESGKFLIVMDDVWLNEDWDRLKYVMPVNSNFEVKVLITSREIDVGKYASRPRDPTPLRFFTDDESWELLRAEALGNLNCPSELNNVGLLIASDCKGLPLSVVVIGGILASKYSSDTSEMKNHWDEVSGRVRELINEKRGDQMNKFISLSYERLPHCLQTCFIYLGIFREDYVIPVSKLTRMWIGEGFIQHERDYSLEKTAERYLEDLINRNLVEVDKIKPNGKVKTCRIHDALREFCRTEAGNERQNIFTEIKYKDEKFEPEVSSKSTTKYRRLSIHSNCSKFLDSNPKGPHVRSFVCIPKEECTLQKEEAIPKAFQLLRVLDVKPLKFRIIPPDMYKMLHLRFITLSFNSNILPENFGKLWNLETLIVNTTSHMLDVKADIWKLKQLRHFKTNVSATVGLKTSTDRNHRAELQTLGTISAQSCTDELVHRASNLKKLGIRGQLHLLLDGKTVPLKNLVKIRNLEKLKLINDRYPELASEGPLIIPPQPFELPSSLRRLTLCATFFSWSYMSTLGLLHNLEVLKLKDKAFMGKIWEGVNGGFRGLKFLHIENTDLKLWAVSTHDDFPILKGLVLRNCEELVKIPIELADRPSFQMLDLNMSESAVTSAREIQEKKRAQGGVAFNLSIFPPPEGCQR